MITFTHFFYSKYALRHWRVHIFRQWINILVYEMLSVQSKCCEENFVMDKIGLFLILIIVALGSSSTPASALSHTPLNLGHRCQASMDDGSLIDEVLGSSYISSMDKHFSI